MTEHARISRYGDTATEKTLRQALRAIFSPDGDARREAESVGPPELARRTGWSVERASDALERLRSEGVIVTLSSSVGGQRLRLAERVDLPAPDPDAPDPTPRLSLRADLFRRGLGGS